MKKSHFTTISVETENLLLRLSNTVTSANAKIQKNYIKEDSPYTSKINNSISNYKEFLLYYSLNLKEAFVTRPSLIKDLDLDLWVTCENKNNRELLQQGSSPYAYDSEEGKIELHHIGQEYDAPFAELTIEEHNLYGNSRILHDNQINSWRQNKDNKNEFYAERSRYWKLRAEGKYKCISNISFKKLEPRIFKNGSELSDSLKKSMETLFSEATIEDLNYISNLANSYAMVKEIGAKNINEFINKDSNESEIVCSFCRERDYSAYGSYKTSAETIKRYKCKKCGKSFTRVNNTIISDSNLSFIEWVRFIDCLYNGFSISKTAEICGLSKQSVQINRYKLFYALKILDDKAKLSGNIVIDETYVNVSYKGNHKTGKIKLPRSARKRGGENHTSGTSKEKVCIVCALDDEGNSIARIAGCGSPNVNRLSVALDSALDVDNIISLYSDKESGLISFAKKNKMPLKSGKLLKKGTKKATNQQNTPEIFIINRYLQKINSYHSRLKRFINKFSGLSSSYLAGYLYLFSWKERNKNRDKSEVYGELLNVLTMHNINLSKEQISMGWFLPNPLKMESVEKGSFQNRKRADDIYALHAKGMTNVEISKIYKMTRQGISYIVRKYEQLNLGYMTEKEKERERKMMEPKPPKGYRQNESQKYIDLYQQKKQWTGEMDEFYKVKMEEYGLSKQTIKNDVCKGRRIVALKESFYIHETFQYKELSQIYQSVYDKYCTLRKNNIAILTCYKMLAEEFDYIESNIVRIVSIMKSNSEEYFNRPKIRLSPNETINRDKALFVDYLKWRGNKGDFYMWASEKYGISKRSVSEIIFYCLSADIKRYDMI